MGRLVHTVEMWHGFLGSPALPAPQLVILLLRLSRPPVNAVTRQPPSMNHHRARERHPDQSERPHPPGGGRNQDNDSEGEEEFSDAPPCRHTFLEMPEQDIAQGEDAGDDDDFPPHGDPLSLRLMPGSHSPQDNTYALITQQPPHARINRARRTATNIQVER